VNVDNIEIVKFAGDGKRDIEPVKQDETNDSNFPF
jgi:hypothetical protein